MTSNNSTENIDIGIYPDINDIIEKCYIIGNNFYLNLKKPKESKIIVTIKTDYTSFRNQIEKLLKEKRIEKEDIKNILNMVDDSNEIIYKDTITAAGFTDVDNDVENKALESDLSDLSDLQKEEKDLEVVNVSDCLKLYRGKVKVKGNIEGISESYDLVSKVTYICECGENVKSFNPPLFTLPKDKNDCKRCRNPIKIDKNLIKYKCAITIHLQDIENFNDLDKLTCILQDIDTKKIKIGEQVTITGDVHILPKLNKKLLIPIVFADEVEYEKKNELTTNQKDIEAIHRFVKQKGPKVIESLVNMFDKSIIGNDLSKEALLYGLVSAGNDLDDIKNKKPRSRLNVLLAGNPGLAKSSLLKKTVTLIPNSRYESVQHSSAKSLTAIVLNEDEHHFLRLGPIPYAKGSICALNELGTMKEEEQSQLLDIMEEGEFTINKFGHNRKIQAPTTIVASSNFKDGIYDFNVTQYLDLLPLEKQLVDRFDIIVIIKDNYRDSKALEEYTDKKIELLSNNVPNYDIFLQNYIEYARRKTIKKFSHGTFKMIKDYYIGLCKSSFTTESNRKLESIIRLCIAVSKLKLKEIVEAEDVIQATRFYSALVYNSMHTRAPIPKDPVNLAIEECIAILKDKKDTSIVYTELLMQVCGKNESVKSYLLGSFSDKMKDQTLLSIHKNKKVRNILDILRNNKYIDVVNKTPIKLQFKEQIAVSSESERSDRSEQIATVNASIDPNVME